MGKASNIVNKFFGGGPPVRNNDPQPGTQEPPVQTPAVAVQHWAPDYYDQVAAALAGAQKQQADEQKKQDEQFHVRRYWPKDKPLPRYHVKREPMPCPKCFRLLLDDLAHATVCASVRNKISYWKCKGCGNKWKMTVKDP